MFLQTLRDCSLEPYIHLLKKSFEEKGQAASTHVAELLYEVVSSSRIEIAEEGTEVRAKGKGWALATGFTSGNLFFLTRAR
jgi:hypothetical protein